jgi:hypothetical protein
MGYSFVYVNNLIRPGDTIDTTLAPLGTALAVRPQRAFSTSDFWLHGINFGLEFRY